MSTFKFSLERVRQLRQRAEKEAAINLARAQVTEHEAQATAEHAAEQTRRASEVLSKTPGSVTKIGELQPMALLRERLGEVERAAEKAQADATAQVAVGTRTLGAAMQARRALDRLHDKQLGSWKADESRDELAVMDEIARVRASHDDPNRRS